MKKRRIQPKTCFLMGAVGAGVYAVAGLLMLLGTGPAAMLRVAAFACVGGMLLFLCVLEKGAAKKGLRIKLLLLFLAWLCSYFNLPPLNFLLEAAVLPLLALMYKDKGHWLCFGVLAATEVAQAAVRTVGVVSYFGQNTLQAEGAALLAVAAARLWMLLVLWRKAPVVESDAQPRLR